MTADSDSQLKISWRNKNCVRSGAIYDSWINETLLSLSPAFLRPGDERARQLQRHGHPRASNKAKQTTPITARHSSAIRAPKHFDRIQATARSSSVISLILCTTHKKPEICPNTSRPITSTPISPLSSPNHRPSTPIIRHHNPSHLSPYTSTITTLTMPLLPRIQPDNPSLPFLRQSRVRLHSPTNRAIRSFTTSSRRSPALLSQTALPTRARLSQPEIGQRTSSISQKQQS